MYNYFEIFFRVIKAGCTFVCFDTNAQTEWNRRLIQALRISDVIALSSYFDKITNLSDSVSLHDEYDLLNEKVQLWKTG